MLFSGLMNPIGVLVISIKGRHFLGKNLEYEVPNEGNSNPSGFGVRLNLLHSQCTAVSPRKQKT